MDRDFSHVSNFTGYMKIILRELNSESRGLRILDIPAGNGLLIQRLRDCGHSVVGADINKEQPDYIFANMDERLPFEDQTFDAVVCMEGIEHTMSPTRTIGELCRITKSGGRIIISLPNIQNTYSRLKFLLTGCFFMFEPWSTNHRGTMELKDRGHISPMTYLQLRYHFEHYNSELEKVRGDKWKKKWLIPLLIPFIAIGWIWTKWEIRKAIGKKRDASKSMFRDLFALPTLFSRSLILVFRKH
jgi:SAM-dependent methyltransferase